MHYRMPQCELRQGKSGGELTQTQFEKRREEMSQKKPKKMTQAEHEIVQKEIEDGIASFKAQEAALPAKWKREALARKACNVRYFAILKAERQAATRRRRSKK